MKSKIGKLLLFVIASAIGCNRSDYVGKPVATKKADEVKAAAHLGVADDMLIRAGYGIPDVHVGMPISELRGGWHVLFRDILGNKQMGIAVNHKRGKIRTIFFHFLSPEFDRFRGGTEAGISADGSLSDVRRKYGDPSYISQSKQSEFGEFPGARDVDAVYVEEGIDFRFVDEKLSLIAVMKPQSDFDYEQLRETLGDSLIYVRDPQEPSRQSP